MEFCSLVAQREILSTSKKLDPALFIGESWSAAEEDERGNVLTEVDLGKIALVTCLSTEEQYLTGEERLKRLKQIPHIRLGGRAFLALWEHQLVIPESWKDQFVFFDGLILLHRNNQRYSLYLSWNDGGWHWYSGWLGNTRSARNPSAVLASSEL